MIGFLSRWGQRLGRAVVSWGLGARGARVPVEVEIACLVDAPRSVEVAASPTGRIDVGVALRIVVDASASGVADVECAAIDVRDVAASATEARTIELASIALRSVEITVAEAA